MFTPAGLYVFLTYESDDDPYVAVDVGTETVRITADDLRCPDCGEIHDVPTKRPAKWIALNSVLNGGRCPSCDA